MSEEKFDKDRFKALLAISKYHRASFEQRRSYQWKVNLALWAGLGAVAGWTASHPVQLDACQRVGVCILLAVILVTYVKKWVPGIENRNQYDRVVADGFVRKAGTLIYRDQGQVDQVHPTAHSSSDGEPNRDKWWNHYSAFSEMAFTFCMVVLVALLLGVFKCGTSARHGHTGHPTCAQTQRSVQ